jgi:hypothetical protein
MVKTLAAIGLGLGIAWSLLQKGAPVGILYPLLAGALVLAYLGGRRRLKPSASASATATAVASAEATATSSGNTVTVNLHAGGQLAGDERRDVVIGQVLNADPVDDRAELERAQVAELEAAGFTGEDVDEYGSDELMDLIRRRASRNTRR